MLNNVGISIQGETRDMTAEHWRRIIGINLIGVVHGSCAAYQVRVRHGSGHIANTASIARAVRHVLATAYAMTRHGVVGLSTSRRAEGAGLGVKVNVVCAAPVKTNIFRAATRLRANSEDFCGRMPERLMVARGEAARLNLRLVARNQAIIVSPFHSRFLW